MKENEFETEEKLTQQPDAEKTADDITASPTVTPVEEEQTEEVQAEETKEEEITEEQTQEEASAEPAKKGKKKIVAVIAAAAVVVLVCVAVLVGRKIAGQKEDSSAQEETAAQEVKDMPSLDNIDVDACVTIPEYKGITVEKQVTPVTDEDVDTTITYSLSYSPMEVSDENAKVEEGDTVNIDYTGTVDGEEFDGGSAEDTDLMIGSGQFIEGFESGLVGHVKGDTVELNLTFPEDYTEDLAGKDVVFTVTINAI